jgi:sodium/hydrogen antiporter
MPAFSPELFVSTLALIGAVIVVSALFSGAVERSGVPQVIIFLAIGALIGPTGLGIFDAHVDSPILRVVASLSLTLVLFTDAVSLNLKEVRQEKWLAMLVLGPGTLFSAVLIAVLAWAMLGLSPARAAILAAALASTDPVLLRSFLKRPALSSGVRQALRLESGMNDAVLLPIVIVAVAILMQGGLNAQEWGKLALNMLVLSPGIGVIIALIAIGLLEFVRKRAGVRRDYESLYSLGVAFAAFAGAEALHGSGFLAAFAAGIAISAIDVELCDCFLEYGETTAEMALLFTFVLFGTSVIWTGFTVMSPTTVAFAALAFLARFAAFIPALLPARTTWRNRMLIAWFGPRGLSSLLLVLIAVFSGVPQADQLISVCSLVVLCSILVHGFSPMFLVPNPVEAPVSTTPVLNPAFARVAAQGREARDGNPQQQAVASPEVFTQIASVSEAASTRQRQPASGASNTEVALEGSKPAPGTLVGHDGLHAEYDGLAKEEVATDACELACELPQSATPQAADGASRAKISKPPPELDSEYITIDDLRELADAGAPVVILDVRTVRTLGESDYKAEGSVRIDPERAVADARAKRIPQGAILAAYCT